MSELLPCPFCGSSNVKQTVEGLAHFIFCDGCGCEGPFDVQEDIAIEAWNTRVIPRPASPDAPKQAENKHERVSDERDAGQGGGL